MKNRQASWVVVTATQIQIMTGIMIGLHLSSVAVIKQLNKLQ
jgi:hypothetical protein